MNIGVSTAIGISIGAAMGSATDNLGMWVASGAAVGNCNQSRCEPHGSEKSTDPPTSSESAVNPIKPVMEGRGGDWEGTVKLMRIVRQPFFDVGSALFLANARDNRSGRARRI